MTTKSLSARQARYAEELAKFDFEIKYKPGKANPADALSRRPDYAKGFKDGSKRTVLNAMLPTLQQKLRVMGLVGGPGATTPNQQVACVQHASDPREHGAGGPRCPAILSETSSIGLIAFDPRENPLAQATVPRDDPASHLRIVRYFAGTDFAQSLVPRQEVVVAALAETAFTEHPPESLVDFIRRVQERDAFTRSICDQLTQGRVPAGNKDYTLDNQGLLRQNNKVWVPNCTPLRQEILKRNHDDPMGGYYGFNRTRKVIARKYAWNGLTKDVRKYIDSCDTYQRFKSRRHKPYSKLQPLQVPTRA